MYEEFIKEITEDRNFRVLIKEMTRHSEEEKILSRCHGRDDDHYLLTSTAVIRVFARKTCMETTINCTRLPLAQIQSVYESQSVKEMELETYIRDREAVCLVPDYSIAVNGIEANFLITVYEGTPIESESRYKAYRQARHFANKLNSLLAGTGA